MTEEKKLALKRAIKKTAEKEYPGDPARQKDYLWRVYTSIKERKGQG